MLNLEQLNDAQRKAVTYGADPLLVLAGPGSGKTTVVVQRIFYLMEHLQISPEHILVLTFTKDAALSMQNRFLQQADKPHPVSFGTFHSCFYHILKNSPGYQKLKLMTDERRRELILAIMKQFFKAKETKESEEILSAISYYKNTNDLEKAKRKLNVELQEQFFSIFTEYEKLRKKEQAIDFDDMVYECFQMLSTNKEKLRYWQHRFSYILLDEFQDINPRQYQVIKLLAGKNCPVFAVGDDDQSIYSFRGASPQCIEDFLQEFHAASIILNQNYRSGEETVKASSAVINQNKKRFEKELYSVCGKSDAGKRVRIYEFDSKKEQYEHILKQLRMCCEPLSQAVLFRTNLQMQRFAIFLKKKGMNYQMKEKSASIYEHFVVKDIMAYLSLSKGKYSRRLYLQIMNKPYRGIDREWIKDNELSESGDGAIQLKQQLNRLRNCSLFLGVQYIRKAIGYEEYLKKRGGKEQFQEWLEVLDFLSEEAKQYHRLEEWIEAQKESEYATHNIEADKQAVQLMTVHGAKGLEFDSVYIPDCNEGIYPYGSMQDESACEEERRILYVAMTRAKKSLELSTIRGNEKHPRLPSRFLNPILSDYSSTISSNSQLSRYSSKASATISYSSSSSI